jgi:cytochrome subunit of sulfide dehydrogenase
MFARSLGAAGLVLALSAPAVAQSPQAPAGALSCSGCHSDAAGVQTPAPRLLGMKPDDMTAAMTAFRTGARHATIMDRIAKGFTDDEIRAIAAWYGARKD